MQATEDVNVMIVRRLDGGQCIVTPMSSNNQDMRFGYAYLVDDLAGNKVAKGTVITDLIARVVTPPCCTDVETNVIVPILSGKYEDVQY